MLRRAVVEVDCDLTQKEFDEWLQDLLRKIVPIKEKANVINDISFVSCKEQLPNEENCSGWNNSNVQVLVIIQEYINLGRAGISGQSQTVNIAIYDGHHFYIDGSSHYSDKITHWCCIPKFPELGN
jgi:hypothetical protein